MKCVLRQSLWYQGHMRQPRSLSLNILLFSREDHYDTLRISKTATLAEVKAAYYELSKTCHPDKYKNDEAKTKEFLKINEAYVVLSDVDSRRKYDNSLTGYSQFRTRQNNPGYQKQRGFENPYGYEYYSQRSRENSERDRYDPFQQESVMRDFERRMTVRTIIVILLVFLTVIHDIKTDNMMFGRTTDIDTKWDVASSSMEAIKNFQRENKGKKGTKHSEEIDK